MSQKRPLEEGPSGTHIEHFSVDLSLWKDKVVLETGAVDIMFDYSDRRIIDHSARIVKVKGS